MSYTPLWPDSRVKLYTHTLASATRDARHADTPGGGTSVGPYIQVKGKNKRIHREMGRCQLMEPPIADGHVDNMPSRLSCRRAYNIDLPTRAKSLEVRTLLHLYRGCVDLR